MKKIIGRSFFVLMMAFAAFGVQAQTPTDESIETLLKVADVEGIIEVSLSDVDKMYDQLFVDMVSKDDNLNDEQRKIMDESLDKTKKIWLSMLSWDMLKPAMIQVYKEVYTQEEVDAMIAFYQTSVGSSIIKKQEKVTRLIHNSLSKNQQEAILKLTVLHKETAEKMNAAAK